MSEHFVDHSLRIIRLVGPITAPMTRRFLAAMDVLENTSDELIIVQIFSEGGDAHAGLAISGRIKNSTVVVDTIIYGTAQSAATLIFAAGRNRHISKLAWVMVHESSDEPGGAVNSSQMKSQAKQMEREDQHWNRFMEEFTGTPAATWGKLDEKETYLNAEQCLELKLATHIF